MVAHYISRAVQPKTLYKWTGEDTVKNLLDGLTYGLFLTV